MFNNKRIKQLEQQLKNITKNYDFLFDNYGGNYGANSNRSLSISNALLLYRECSPFYMVIDKIVNSYCEIPFTIFDKKNKKFIENHPVLDLLKTPNYNDTQTSFKESIASMFLITGNIFLLATGNVDRPILELFNLSPNFFTPISGVANVYTQSPDKWQYSNGITQDFFLDETINGYKYYNQDMSQELYHIRKFNPIQRYNSYFGMSKAYPLFQEMESYIAGNNNNSSLLKNGSRPSMAWVNNRGEELTEKQYERMQQEAKKFSGSDNAGRTPILDGMDIKEISNTNKDMQFKELQDSMLSRIANVYGVPLALLLDSTMTMNNLQTARLHLDKDAVIPLAKKINQELTKFLLPRYPDSENLEFSLDITEIESLKPEVLENALLMKNTGVNTINEIRVETGYQHLEVGGDVLTSSNNNSSFDLDSFDNQENSDNIEDDSKEYGFFYNNMKKENLKDDEIKSLWILSKVK